MIGFGGVTKNNGNEKNVECLMKRLFERLDKRIKKRFFYCTFCVK